VWCVSSLNWGLWMAAHGEKEQGLEGAWRNWPKISYCPGEHRFGIFTLTTSILQAGYYKTSFPVSLVPKLHTRGGCLCKMLWVPLPCNDCCVVSVWNYHFRLSSIPTIHSWYKVLNLNARKHAWTPNPWCKNRRAENDTGMHVNMRGHPLLDAGTDVLEKIGE